MQEQSITYIEDNKLYTDFFTYNENSIKKRKFLGVESDIDRLDIDFINYICNKSSKCYVDGLDMLERDYTYAFDRLFKYVDNVDRLYSYTINPRLQFNKQRRLSLDDFKQFYTKDVATNIDIFRQLDIYMLYSFSKLVPVEKRSILTDYFNTKSSQALEEANRELAEFLGTSDFDIKELMYEIRNKKYETSYQEQLEKKVNKIRQIVFDMSAGVKILKHPLKSLYNIAYHRYAGVVTEIAQRKHYLITISLLGIKLVVNKTANLESFYKNIGYDINKMIEKEYRQETMRKALLTLRENEDSNYAEGNEAKFSQTNLIIAEVLNNIFIKGNRRILLFGLNTCEVTFAVDYNLDIHSALTIISQSFITRHLEMFMTRAQVYYANRLTAEEVFDINNKHNIKISNICNKTQARKYYANSEEDIAAYKDFMEISD